MRVTGRVDCFGCVCALQTLKIKYSVFYVYLLHTVCYFICIFHAVIRQISMLFIDNKDSLFCILCRSWQSNTNLFWCQCRSWVCCPQAGSVHTASWSKETWLSAVAAVVVPQCPWNHAVSMTSATPLVTTVRNWDSRSTVLSIWSMNGKFNHALPAGKQ